MEIKKTTVLDEEDDLREGLCIETVDGTHNLNFLEGEPEDANLGRDFSDVHKILSLVKAAHEAGKNGEDLIITETHLDSIEEW